MTDYIKKYLNDQYNYKNFKSFFIINESYDYLYMLKIIMKTGLIIG